MGGCFNAGVDGAWRERIDTVTSYLIPEGLEGLIEELPPGCERGIEGLRSDR